MTPSYMASGFKRRHAVHLYLYQVHSQPDDLYRFKLRKFVPDKFGSACIFFYEVQPSTQCPP